MTELNIYLYCFVVVPLLGAGLIALMFRAELRELMRRRSVRRNNRRAARSRYWREIYAAAERADKRSGYLNLSAMRRFEE